MLEEVYREGLIDQFKMSYFGPMVQIKPDEAQTIYNGLLQEHRRVALGDVHLGEDFSDERLAGSKERRCYSGCSKRLKRQSSRLCLKVIGSKNAISSMVYLSGQFCGGIRFAGPAGGKHAILAENGCHWSRSAVFVIEKFPCYDGYACMEYENAGD